MVPNSLKSVENDQKPLFEVVNGGKTPNSKTDFDRFWPILTFLPILEKYVIERCRRRLSKTLASTQSRQKPAKSEPNTLKKVGKYAENPYWGNTGP